MSRGTIALLALLVVLSVIAIGIWRSFGTDPIEAEAASSDPSPAAHLVESEALVGSPTAESEEEPLAGPSSVETRESVRPRPFGGRVNSQPPRVTEVELQEAAWIEGRVVVPAGTPVDEHLVVLADGDRFPGGGRHRAEVGADGTFRVAFAPATKTGTLTLEARYLYIEERIDVDPREPPKELVLRPKLGARILGRVVRPEGSTAGRDPIAGARVRLLNREGPGFERAPYVRRTARISKSLAFELVGVPAGGPYAIELRRMDDWCGSIVKDVRVEAGELRDVVLQIVPCASVRGSVVDENGSPLGRTRVQAFVGADNLGGPSTRSDAEGRFRLNGIHPGSVHLVASDSSSAWSKVEIGSVLDGAVVENVRIVLRGPAPISGRVLWPNGSPAPHSLVAYRFERLSLSGDSKPTRDSVATGEDGRFEIKDAGPGPVELTASARPTVEGSSDDAVTSEAAVASQSRWVSHVSGVMPGTEGLILRLGPGESILGRILDEAGSPIGKGALVQAASQGLEDGPQIMAFADADGAFRLDGLHDGAWRLTAKCNGYAESTSLVTLPNAGRPVEITLLRGSTISGVVVDPLGRPVPEADVYAWRLGSFDSDDPTSAMAGSRTDSEGRFTIENLSAGFTQVGASGRGWHQGEPISIEVQSGQAVGGLTIQLGQAIEPK